MKRMAVLQAMFIPKNQSITVAESPLFVNEITGPAGCKIALQHCMHDSSQDSENADTNHYHQKLQQRKTTLRWRTRLLAAKTIH